MKSILVILIFLVIISTQVLADDSTLVRIRTDIESVELKINDSLYLYDNDNNMLAANNWFIISLSNGEYHFVLQSEEEILDTVITVDSQQLIALEFSFIQRRAESEKAVAGDSSKDIEKRVFVSSVPDSGTITIDGTTLELFTPTFLATNKDSVTVQVYKDGYEPLVTELMTTELQKKQVQFILMPLQPAYLDADSLGYSLEEPMPILDIRIAKKLQAKYMSLAETFMIFPFAQGLILKVASRDDNQGIVNVMVGSGAVLTVGSYLLSKILSKRKREQIKDTNIEIDFINLEIKSRNREVETLIREQNAERINNWKIEKRGKGVVKIIDTEQ